MEEEDHYELTHRLTESSKLKKSSCVIASIVVAFIVAVATIVALSAVVGVTNYQNSNRVPPAPRNESNTTDDGVCLTASCVDLASFARQTMDESVDPCDDFYKFSCGGWEQNNVVPPGMPSNEMAGQLITRNTIALKKILDSGNDDGVEAVMKVIDLYQSCLNTSVIEAAGVQPLLDLINMSGGWSLLNGNDSGWSISSEGFVKEKYLGSTAFFVLDLDIYSQNSSRYILTVQQSGLSLGEPAAYLDPSRIRPFRDLIVSVLSKLNPNNMSHDVFEEAADGIVEFESNLAQIFEDVSKLDVAKIKPIKVGELANFLSNFEWVKFLKAVFRRVSVTVDANESVLVPTLSFFRNLTHVIASANSSVLENYAKWQLIKGYFSYLAVGTFQSAPFSKKLYTSTHGSSIINDMPIESLGDEDRYKTCIDVAQTTLPMALARIFARHILAKNTKGNVSIMVGYVKSAFKDRLDENTWLDDPTKKNCKEKVDAVTKFISYPDELFNDTYLNNLYSKHTISRDDYFGNYRRSIVLKTEATLKQLHDKVDKEKFMWSNPPTQVNAFYSPQVNSIIIMEGISRVPWFDPGWPDYFKYGALGAVVAHELTHGFDNQGRNYDKDGNLKPWWTNASVEAFGGRQDCFVEQYSAYEMFGYPVDGNLTLPDNIADNGGLKVGFKAYKEFVRKNPDEKEKTLPLLNKYTPEQLYFIGWAQLWCSIYTEEGFQATVKTDHSPGPFRVKGTVVNSPEFASAFQCHEGSNMNPKHKCLMW